MSRTTSVIISALLLVLAVLLFTVWREAVMDEYGAYVAIGFALLAVFLASAPLRARPGGDKDPD